MENIFEIEKCDGLFGEITNQTSKNATLPILAASILCDEKVTILNAPQITDVENMIKMLKKIGVKVKRRGRDVEIDSKSANKHQIDCELSKTMRSSIFLLGALLSRFKEAIITMPGGCKIGARPIDIHIQALKDLGVEIKQGDESISFKQKGNKSLKASRIHNVKLKLPSVGATENVILYTCKLDGVTIIRNPAKEPEVVDLCNFLNQMGAKILGAGTDKITIYGVDKLYNTKYKPIGDRIVAGTIMAAVAIAGGDVTITNAVPYQNEKLIKIMRSMGCQIDYKNDIIHIASSANLRSYKLISTGFYPKFPTDMQSLLLTLSCVAQGQTIIKENVFENRFLNLSDLSKMGAKITKRNSKSVIVNGVQQLTGSVVQAHDLRGGAGLVVAGLIATGKTIVKGVEFIDRGYENLENTLRSLGAKIRRL